MIHIAIVDDHLLIRTGLRQFLDEQAGLKVVGEASDGAEAMSLAQRSDVDVMLLDLSMPKHGGVDALAAIRSQNPALPVLILSGFPEHQYAAPLLRQGASGYLNKGCDAEDIVTAIRTVARSKKYITPAVAEQLADQIGRGNEAAPHEDLSDREFQVFMRLAQGDTITRIAEDKSLSVKTVSTYRTRVMEKMGLTSNSDLTYYALRAGLIQ